MGGVLAEQTVVPYNALVEAAPDAILAVASDGRIVLANAQAERLFGYPRAELVGQRIEMLVPAGVRERHAGFREAYLADPRPRPMGAGVELVARRKDGSEFPAEISLSGIPTPGGLVVSAAVRDVTERKQAEAERARLHAEAERERLAARDNQAQRLESLGQLAGGIAHDFNNLLAVILNYASFVAERVEAAAAQPGGDGWRGVADDVGQIALAADHAARLTHQLLAFGRRDVVRPQVVDLNDVVRDVEALLARTLGEHVILATSLTAGLWPVSADLGHLEQILVNLAVNARDAMPDGGTLGIDTANVEIDADHVSLGTNVTPGRHVRLRVSDTGRGMTPDVTAHAFEPFFTTKPKGEGSGLGLATVYGIVVQAGGVAHIYSEPGLGTTVTALFPAADAAVSPSASFVSPAATEGHETVLVVEDEGAIREITRRVLSRAGYDVVVAANGADMIRILANNSNLDLDLLLTDVVMPGMLGTEVVQRVRDVHPDVRVVFMSGYAQPVLAVQGRLEPGVALLEKPFSAPELLSIVRAALDA